MEREAAEAQQETARIREEIRQKEQETARIREEIKQREQEAAQAREEVKQREQEAARAKEAAIVKMLASGLLTDEQIAEFQNVPLLQVQDIKRTL
jgi:predicted nuclease with TOPRIM domain